MGQHILKASYMKQIATYESLEQFQWADLVGECKNNLPILTNVLECFLVTVQKISKLEKIKNLSLTVLQLY
jgi:hypothetical protein